MKGEKSYDLTDNHSTELEVLQSYNNPYTTCIV